MGRPSRLTLLALCGLLPWLASGCAAMFTGTTDEVTFLSDPPGATVRVDGKEGVTPCNIEVSKKTKEATFSDSEHGEHVVAVERSFQGGMLLMDILFTPGFGLSGILVDSISSAYYDLTATVTANMIALAAARDAAPATAVEASSAGGVAGTR